jgi:hypothetical protein
MTKEQLAASLRQFLYASGTQYMSITDAKERVDVFSDEEIIILANTCVVCNEMRDDYQWLQTAIRIADDVDDFWSLTSPIHEHERDQLGLSEDSDPFLF